MKLGMYNKALKSEGFTLIEVITAITIFVVVLTACIDLFMSAMQEQQRNLDRVYLLNNTSYAVEYMARALRMAHKDRPASGDGSCIGLNANYQRHQASPNSVQFLNQKNKCQAFYKDADQLMVKRSTDSTAGSFQTAEELLPSDIKVNDFVVLFSGETQVDAIQPAVTFVLKTETGKAKQLVVQRTVSQRELDVEY